MLRGGLFHAIDQCPQLIDLLRLNALRETAADPFIENGAHLVDFVGFLDGDLTDEYAAILFQAHQSHLLERAKSLAHGTTRHPEPLRQSRFGELGACRKLAREDHALQLLLHQIRQRIGLDQGNGMGRLGFRDGARFCRCAHSGRLASRRW